MPPTLSSTVDSQKTWFRSPLMTFHQNFIPRRRLTNNVGNAISPTTLFATHSPSPISNQQHQQRQVASEFNDSWKPQTLITRDNNKTNIYSKLVTDKEGMPLICTKSYLTQFEKQQMRVAHDHRNCWPSKNHRNDNSSSCTRNRDHDVVNSMLLSTVSSSSTMTKTNLTISKECYMNSENCLPRIIKPRKRRKKDRKPNPATFTNSSIISSATPSLSVQQLPQRNVNQKLWTDSSRTGAATVSGSSDEGRHTRDDIHRPPFLSSSSDNILLGLHVALSRTNPKAKSTSTSATGEVPRSLVNVLAENGGRSGALSAQKSDQLSTEDDVPVESTTSVCRCKYCEPESVIWDVSQRCFSPNLMPPPVGKAITLQNSSSAKLGYTTLKRSSSEPTSKPFINPVVARVRSFSNGSCDKFSQNLLVSSQIVTSHDGHRDIEVKFFSLPTSSSSSHVPE